MSSTAEFYPNASLSKSKLRQNREGCFQSRDTQTFCLKTVLADARITHRFPQALRLSTLGTTSVCVVFWGMLRLPQNKVQDWCPNNSSAATKRRGGTKHAGRDVAFFINTKISRWSQYIGRGKNIPLIFFPLPTTVITSLPNENSFWSQIGWEVERMSMTYLAGHRSSVKHLINEIQDKPCAQYTEQTGLSLRLLQTLEINDLLHGAVQGLKIEVSMWPSHSPSLFTFILGISSMQTSATAWHYSYIV